MKKISQGEVEREFQKALAVEYVKNYCKKNGLSIQKLVACPGGVIREKLSASVF